MNLHVGVDPWDKVAGLGVDSWESWLGTTVSPADDSVKSESAHEWATGVSLAGVLATGIKTGTDHRVGDVILTISISAVIITDNWDLDLHEGTCQGSSLRCGSASGYGAHVSGGILLSRGWDSDGVDDGGAQVGALGEPEHADVVLDGPGVVVLVVGDGVDGDVGLVGIVLVQVVASNSDSQSAGRLSITAMSGGDDSVSGDQGSSTHQGASNSSSKESDLMGEFSWVGLSSSNDSASASGHGGGQKL